MLGVAALDSVLQTKEGSEKPDLKHDSALELDTFRFGNQSASKSQASLRAKDHLIFTQITNSPVDPVSDPSC